MGGRPICDGNRDPVSRRRASNSEPELRDWYRELDLLPGGIETVIGADSTLNELVDRIVLDTGLAGLPALER
ncbi:hypothetical protein ACWCXB_28265 [Streptomyces sp. NPDC001514]